MSQGFDIGKQVRLNGDGNSNMDFHIGRVGSIEFGKVMLIPEFAHFFKIVGFGN